MKIVKRIEFMKLPPETVYCEYEPCAFGELLIKGDTLSTGNDWFYQDIVSSFDAQDCGEWSAMLFRSAETGESVPMDFDCQSRDGRFDPDDRLYAVWEPQDVQHLINRLKRCVGATTSGEVNG
jgi:hypothetical protein